MVVHFSKRTELDDYVAAAHRKVVRIHRELPPGGILVFATGQREVQALSAQLRATLATRPQRPQHPSHHSVAKQQSMQQGSVGDAAQPADGAGHGATAGEGDGAERGVGEGGEDGGFAGTMDGADWAEGEADAMLDIALAGDTGAQR